MAAPLQTWLDYVVALHKLMPQGPAWPRDPGTVQDSTLAGLANVFHILNSDANDLLVDAFPATAVDLLGEWEATCGTDGTGSVSDREAAVMAVLEATGGSTVAFFRALVLSYGFTKCVIYQYTFSTVKTPVNQKLGNIANAFEFAVSSWGAGNSTAMEAAVNRYKPAHTIVTFSYH